MRGRTAGAFALALLLVGINLGQLDALGTGAGEFLVPGLSVAVFAR
ncbi:hypothetical protein [uncultured Marinobacter sp.]|nr:hypothetical protein [uncultured Marinobacter sp.]